MRPTPPPRPLEQNVFDAWPSALCTLFDGASLATRAGFTASLVTADATGQLRTSLLSAGELYAPDEHTLRIALWPQARAARVLREQQRGALTFVHDATFYQVQLRFTPLDPAPGDSGGLVYFAGVIEAGETQRVRYARLTSGIAFDIEVASEGEAVLERWAQQIGWLKQAVAGG